MVDSIVVVWSLVTLASCSSVLNPIQNDFDSGLQASVDEILELRQRFKISKRIASDTIER